MILSLFTTVTNPTLRGDNIKDALKCYDQLADEIVVIDGDNNLQLRRKLGKQVRIKNYWPKEFIWPFIGYQFTKGYQACNGDAVIHADLDFIFHEKDIEAIRQAAEIMLDNNAPAMSFYKHQFILPDRYNLKSRLVIMVNKRDFGDRIKFDSGGDLAQPSLDGIYLNPDDLLEAGIAFNNYEKLLKTKEQIADDQGRMERAYKRHFGHTQMVSDGTDEDAYIKWIEAQVGKFAKPQKRIELEEHPKYVQETIRDLKPENWGYNGHGYLETNDYVNI